MTDQERQNWLAGKWIVVPQPFGRLWLVRRQEKGTVIDHHTAFPKRDKAQKRADRLNSIQVSS